MTEEKLDEVLTGLKKMGAEGFIWLSCKAEDTEDNRLIHNAFRAFCKAETDNDYTLGIRLLLTAYDSESKFNGLWAAIESLQKEINELKQQPKVIEEEKRF